jgi:hypothetical protein
MKNQDLKINIDLKNTRPVLSPEGTTSLQKELF